MCTRIPRPPLRGVRTPWLLREIATIWPLTYVTFGTTPFGPSDGYQKALRGEVKKDVGR